MSIHIPASEGEAATAVVRTSLPDQLPILPLRDSVPFPEALTPLAIGQERSIELVNDVLAGNRMLVMVASKDPGDEEPGPDDLYRVGVAGVVARMLKVPDGTLRILVHGAQRVRIEELRLRGAVPRRANRGGAGRDHALARAGGAAPQRPDDLLAHHRGAALPARGAAGCGRQPRRPKRARAHDRRCAADRDGEEAAAARGARRRQTAAAAVRDPGARARAGRDRHQDPVAGPLRDGEGPARVLPAPAAEGDPGGARRRRRDAGRGQRAARAARAGGPARVRHGSRPSASCSASSGCRRRRPSTASSAPTSNGWRRCPGRPQPRTTSTSSTRARCSTATTTTSRRSRTASSSSSQCASSSRTRARRSSASSARRASARPRSAARSLRRWSASSSASRSAVCATSPRSAAIAAPTSARCRARSCARCATPSRTTRC